MKKLCLLLGLALMAGLSARAEIPPAEKILPDDTLALFTVPDCVKAREAGRSSPQMQIWSDPAMQPFREKLLTKLNTELIGPLQRDLGISFSNYAGLAQGQMTFAVVQNGWQGATNPLPGWLFLLDTKTKSAQLKTNLADLKSKWAAAGKSLKTDKIHGVDFTIFLLSSNDVPASLKKFASAKPVIPNFIPDDAHPEPPAPPAELYLGQSDSLLIAGSTPAVLEKLLLALGGGASSTLAEQATFAANQSVLFRDASFYGWANTRIVFDILVKTLAAKADDADAERPSPLPFRPEKLLTASGLAALRSVAFSAHPGRDGSSAQVLLTVPESERQGLLKILAGEAKPTQPPAFVPADVTKFTRWRFGGEKSWDILEKTLNEVSPQLLAGFNFALMSAGAAAKDKDPDFDLKKSFVSNLGDDIIAYQKAPRSKELADIAAPPSLFLISSPQPDKLLNALKTFLTMLNRRGDPPVEREFLGRKIYSITTGPARLVNGEKTGPRALSLTAASGYVALSMDSGTLEEFLRSGETPGKPLREIPGLADAVQKVAGDGNSFFSYENQRETMRTAFELFKRFGSTNSIAKPGGALGLMTGQNFLKDWADVSLLPDYDQVAKYFYFAVTAARATPDGLTLKIFSPRPPPAN